MSTVRAQNQKTENTCNQKNRKHMFQGKQSENRNHIFKGKESENRKYMFKGK